MAVYTANLLVVSITSLLAGHFSFRSPIRPDGTQKPLLWFVLLTVLSLSLVSGMRFLVGTDYVNYSIMYEDVRTSGMAAMEMHQIEPGYVVLSALFGLFFQEPFAFFFFVSLLTNLLIVLALRENSVCFWLSCALYILTFSFFNTFNLVRQSIAMSIVFFAHRSLVEKRMLAYFLLVGFAALFHASVLVMIPVYFIVQRPAWSPIIYLGFFAVLLFFVFYDSVVNILFAVLSETRYSAYEEMMKNSENGINVLRVAVAGAPVLLSFLFRRQLRQKYPEFHLVNNMAVLAFLVSLISLKQIYFTRISLYFSIYYLLLLPYLILIFKDTKLRIALGGVILVCYLAYCYMLLPTEGGVLPYTTICSAPPRWNIMDYIFTR